jgi:hypothetical protein
MAVFNWTEPKNNPFFRIKRKNVRIFCYNIGLATYCVLKEQVINNGLLALQAIISAVRIID